MPTRLYDPWRDADGTPIVPHCRIQQIPVGKQHGALPSRLHQQGQVLGRGVTRLIVQFDHENTPVGIQPHLVCVLTTPGDCSVSDTLTELERAEVPLPRCDAEATERAGVPLVAPGPVPRRTP